jgi:signal peptidase II
MYWVTPARHRIRLAAIALICGGAIGNLIDRVRSARGVIDFVDIGVGDVRWPVFNVADVAVTTGAILLALTLWQEEHEAREAAPSPTADGTRADGTVRPDDGHG